MDIIRSNYLKIIPKNSFEQARIEQFLKEKCTFLNPLYEKSMKYLKNKLFSKEPKYIQTYEKVRQFDLTYFNVMKANKEIFDEVQKIGLKVENFIDERIDERIEIENIVEPRDEEQKKAINSIINNNFNYGILSASPSSGKTFISLYCACKFKQRILILVDMTLLIDQFVDSILKFTNIKEEDIGYIRGQEKNYQDKKIVIATIQTLSKKENINIIDYLSKKIGFVICDEVHVMSCETAQKVLKHFRPKYMLGLSGTPKRDDKMDFIISQTIGPIIHKSDRQAMVEAGSMVTPILRPIFLKDDELFQKYNIDNEIDFRDVVYNYYNSPKAIDKISNLIFYHYTNNDSQLVICKEKDLIDRYYGAIIKKIFGNDLEKKAEEERLKIIEKDLKKIEEYKNASHILVMSDLDKVRFQEGLIDDEFIKNKYSKKLEEFKEMKINKLEKEIQNIDKRKWFDMPCIKKIDGINSIRIFTGNNTKKERDKIMEDINNGTIKITLVTTTFDKALSCNRLNILYLLFSTRERANTTQRIGRISRTYENKKPSIVYDIIYDHYMSYYQFNNSKGECRMEAYKGFVKIHNSIYLLLEYLRCRFKQETMEPALLQEWNKWKNKYIINLD